MRCEHCDPASGKQCLYPAGHPKRHRYTYERSPVQIANSQRYLAIGRVMSLHGYVDAIHSLVTTERAIPTRVFADFTFAAQRLHEELRRVEHYMREENKNAAQ
jgi:hypothetical protein